MPVAIGPLGLSLHLICCLIYYAPHPVIKFRRISFDNSVATCIINVGLSLPALGASPRRDCPDERRADNYIPRGNHRCPPTAEQLRHDYRVKKILEEAWRYSNYGQPNCREVGGWIYQDKHGNIYHRYQEPDCGSCAKLRGHGNPPLRGIPGVIIALFHTHPNPSGIAWDAGPSREDKELAYQHNVPGLVITDQGIFVYGPERGQWNVGPVNCRK